MYRDISQLPMQKRNYNRHAIFVPVQFKERDEHVRAYIGTLTRDLSLSGARILMQDFTAPNSKVALILPSPPFKKELHLIARVAWTCKLPHSDQYEAGLEFRELPHDDQREIASLIASSTHTFA